MWKNHRFWRHLSATSALVACTMFYSTTASALVTCTSARIDSVNFEAPPEYKELNVPILASSVTVSALRDLPFGSELYSQRITNIGSALLGYGDCTTSTGSDENVGIKGRIEFEHGTPATVGQYQGFDVYETGTPGIGFSLFWRDHITNRPLPADIKSTSSVPLNSPTMSLGYGDFYFALVKIADIPAGTWSLPVNIPPIITYVEPVENIAADFTVKGQRIRISGNLNVVAGSCQTPDVHVQLGEYEITENMVSTTQWSSPWKDFNIQLINCPAMLGRYEEFLSPSNRWAGEGSSNTVVNAPRYYSVIAYRLDPIGQLGSTYATSGLCVKTDPVPNGSEGLCIEIEDLLLDTLSKSALDHSSHVWRGKAFLTQFYLDSHATSYTIPLRARYSRMRKDVGTGVVPLKPGTANAAVEFTIFYE